MKRYRVSGTQRVAGHEPGDEFQASYSEAHEQYLITAGHVELVARKSASKSAHSKHDEQSPESPEDPSDDAGTTSP